jgi:L-ascorbate oxidase
MLVGRLHKPFIQSLRSTAAALIGLTIAASAAFAAGFVEPTVISSSNGVLDLLMIARAKPVSTITYTPPGGSPMNPTGWVYEICPRPASSNRCPPGSTVSDYGGVRLALQKGDTLKIRLVNELPQIDPAKLTHVLEPGQANLFRSHRLLCASPLGMPIQVVVPSVSLAETLQGAVFTGARGTSCSGSGTGIGG